MFSIFSKKITKDYYKKYKEVDYMEQNFLKKYSFLFITLIFIILTGVYFTEEKPEENEASSYILREYNGRLAVFENKEDIPEEILDVSISIFPENDIIKLREGITAESRDELMRLIEDFSG